MGERSIKEVKLLCLIIKATELHKFSVFDYVNKKNFYVESRAHNSLFRPANVLSSAFTVSTLPIHFLLY